MIKLIVVFILGFGAGVFTLTVGSVLFKDYERQEDTDDEEV